MSLLTYLTSEAGLRRVLWVDALSGIGMAALHLGLGATLSQWLGYPASWLTASGWLVLVFALFAAGLARRPQPPSLLLAVLASGNFAWVIASVTLALSGAGHPTSLGLAYLGVQAAAVLVLAELQWMGLRRQRLQTVA